MNRPERQLARSVKHYLDRCAPSDLFWTAINPAPPKGQIFGAIAKAMGQRAGVPDYLFVWQGRAFFVELKAEKGRESANQKHCHQTIREAGGKVHTVRSLDELEGVLAAWRIPVTGRISLEAVVAAARRTA